jgi:uncharacterized membrane protein YhdT
MGMESNNRNRQIKRESILSLSLYLGFFLWWFITGYGLSQGSPAQFTYVLGMPMWFFLSCVVGYVLFCAAAFLLVKRAFKELSLDDGDGERKNRHEQ